MKKILDFSIRIQVEGDEEVTADDETRLYLSVRGLLEEYWANGVLSEEAGSCCITSLVVNRVKPGPGFRVFCCPACDTEQLLHCADHTCTDAGTCAQCGADMPVLASFAEEPREGTQEPAGMWWLTNTRGIDSGPEYEIANVGYAEAASEALYSLGYNLEFKLHDDNTQPKSTHDEY